MIVHVVGAYGKERWTIIQKVRRLIPLLLVIMHGRRQELSLKIELFFVVMKKLRFRVLYRTLFPLTKGRVNGRELFPFDTDYPVIKTTKQLRQYSGSNDFSGSNGQTLITKPEISPSRLSWATIPTSEFGEYFLSSFISSCTLTDFL